MKYQIPLLTEQQLRNLAEFLLRTDLKGREASAHVELGLLINSAKPVEERPAPAPAKRCGVSRTCGNASGGSKDRDEPLD